MDDAGSRAGADAREGEASRADDSEVAPEVLARDYARLREAAGIPGVGGRALLRVWGDRARDMVGGLVTSHVAALEPGGALYAFMLTPKGRPVAEMRVLALSASELWLDLPEACLEGTLGHLSRYLPPIYAQHERMEERVRLSVIGPAWARVASALPGAPPAGELEGLAPLDTIRLGEADAGGGVSPAAGRSPGSASGDGAGPALPAGADLLCRREPIEGPGADLYVARERAGRTRELLLEAAGEAGGGAVGPAALEAWRVERGVPIYGREIDLEVLPQETGQTGRAVDFEKGCYTGQEVVARIHYRGHVHRRLVGLRFGEGGGSGRGGAPGSATPTEASVGEPSSNRISEGAAGEPAPGAALYAEGRERGRVTTVTDSPRLGAIGLGYVRREVEAGERLALEADGEPAAEVVELPFPGAGH